ncbi:hypothetical protein Hanom_Chr15g01406521 [Helianthus anomalus]
MSSVPSATERTGTENSQKWIPVLVLNIPGLIPVRYRYLRVKTGKYRYRTGTENVKSRYRIGTQKVPGRVTRY